MFRDKCLSLNCRLQMSLAFRTRIRHSAVEAVTSRPLLTVAAKSSSLDVDEQIAWGSNDLPVSSDGLME